MDVEAYRQFLDVIEPSLMTYHVDGVAWYDAPLPPPGHQCRSQTTAYTGDAQVFRCACGALAFHEPIHWLERNSRRRTP